MPVVHLRRLNARGPSRDGGGTSRGWRTAAIALVLVLAGCSGKPPVAVSEAKTQNVPVAIRRLTQSQYRNIIADVFGPGIRFSGSMDPDFRKDGLLAIGASEATFSPSSLEQYDALARSIAADVLSEKNRKSLLPCQPAAEHAPDPSCAAQTIGTYGRLLFRRPLTPDELRTAVGIADDQAQKLGGFYPGLEFALASLLVSPNFLFQMDAVEENPHHPGPPRLDIYSRASRLSFFLWNSAPDDMLLRAAESGALNTSKGLAQQVDRLMASPRLKNGVRAFFDDFLRFSELKTLTKDTAIYPRFSLPMGDYAREQTLRTIEEVLVTEDGDYRSLFTTRKTFMNRPLGVAYRVPVAAKNGWMPYEFSADDPRAGILTQLSFTALYALPGRSSPTLRGKAIREIFLCQRVPDPPNNVDFSKFEDPKSAIKTVRDRLSAHATNPVCAGCHRLIDPLGLALEKFDGLGAFRDRENGEAIDASGQLDSTRFSDAAGLGQAMADNPQVSACFVNQVYAYGVGHKPSAAESAYLQDLNRELATQGYKIRQVLRRIATSDAFYSVAVQDMVKMASNTKE